jgi:hypothetical protein
VGLVGGWYVEQREDVLLHVSERHVGGAPKARPARGRSPAALLHRSAEEGLQVRLWSGCTMIQPGLETLLEGNEPLAAK